MLETKEFLNPYNFISLPKQKAKAYEDTDKHTGVIEYSITTRSPLFIPNHSSVKNKDKNKDKNKEELRRLDFFSYNDLKGAGLNPNKYYSPVIPGSELRGMIRSVYETLTDSCMGVLNEDIKAEMRVFGKKEIAEKTIGDVAGDFAPCKTNENRCPSCDLFGMVGNDNIQAQTSKIRFSDGIPEKDLDVKEYYLEDVILEPLASPRVSNIEFYLERPNDKATFWNYDYYIIGNTKEPQSYPETSPATLRGRKYYWHNIERKFPKVDKKKLQETNMEVRPVKKDITFVGKVYFDGISQKQLNQLLWILNGGKDEKQPKTGNIAYKLGAGKPLGLGSVELKVINCKKRIIEMAEDKISYTVEDIKKKEWSLLSYDNVGFSITVKDEFFTIASLDAAQEKIITYPIIEGQDNKPLEKGYEWFVKNHKCGTYRRYALPKIKGVGTLPIDPTKSNNSGKQNDKEIECTISAEGKEDNKNNKLYVHEVSVNNESQGMVFKCKEKLDVGTRIRMKVTKVKNNKIFGDFRGVVDERK